MRTVTLRFTICLAMFALALALAATAAAHDQWNAATEFSDTANPAPDHHARAGVWAYLEGPVSGGGNPTGFTGLVDGGTNIWVSATPETPGGGTGGGGPKIDLRSDGVLQMYPATDRYAILSWTSPITGSVPVTGSIRVGTASCGSGVSWSIRKGTTTLASGSLPPGAQEFASGTGGSSLASVSVSQGDVLYLIVDPAPGNSLCDTVEVDLTIGSGTTAVSVSSLRAIGARSGVLVRWRAASEIGTLGFHVYREVNGKRVRVTSRLIAARGGGSYSFLDRRAPRRKQVRYWLQAVDLDGSRVWHGPARVART